MPEEDKINYDKFVGDGDEFYSPLCNTCAHKNGMLTCNAFPDGIPGDIFDGVWDHTIVYPDQQNEITYKELKE